MEMYYWRRALQTQTSFAHGLQALSELIIPCGFMSLGTAGAINQITAEHHSNQPNRYKGKEGQKYKALLSHNKAATLSPCFLIFCVLSYAYTHPAEVWRVE